MLKNNTIDIALTDDELALAIDYAKMHAITLETAFKRALFEAIEDEIDLATAELVYKRYLENPQTIDFDEAIELLADDE